MEKQKTTLYLVTKTVLYRILSVSMNTVLLYILLGDGKKAAQFAIVVFIAHTLFYYLYEWLATKYDEKYYYKVKNET
jgi:uncharacterized membrane protein